MERLFPIAEDLNDPARLLAFDEAALDLTEDTGRELFWTWESCRHFVAVGLGQSVAREVELEFCRAHGIPIFRRCSGGGAVVQGPGCLSYGVTLLMDRNPALAAVTATNHWVMARTRDALIGLGVGGIRISGYTDLALAMNGRPTKFSGNAQRRRRRALLFHGTLLHGFDLSLLARCLRHPSAEPDYRGGRHHGEFVANLAVSRVRIETALAAAWQAQTGQTELAPAAVEALAERRYRSAEWNFRR
jgi:lipoate-protein ligase A